MIYAYCLSVFSIHFFAKHNISRFKLRLINQQTADCTDSVVLNAANLSSDTFPVSIKLKGGERLLMKVKLLSLPNGAAEVLVGEGVVNFDKSSIDNSLRVPIYDKTRGVEEVAICSIDFFLSGFEVQKNVSSKLDKSRSRFDDWRERTEDAVYSQMSYTVQSQEEGNLGTSRKMKQSHAVGKREDVKNDPKKTSQQKAENIPNRRKIPDIEEEDEEGVDKATKAQKQCTIAKEGRQKPFILENNVYLESQPYNKLKQTSKVNKSPIPKELIKTKKSQKSQASPSARSNHLQRKKFAFESMQEDNFDNKMEETVMSPQMIKERMKQNQQILSKLKKYMANAEKAEQQVSPKHKRRRKKIKVEEFTAYNLQNNFVKYHEDKHFKSSKVIRSIKAIRIIQNQIKEPSDEKIIFQSIDKLYLSSMTDQKILTFDVLGFRSYCHLNNQRQDSASIMIPQQENALKVVVKLSSEGTFQGVIGLQQGEQMNIKLTRIDAHEDQYILQRSQFKLIFDIKDDFIYKKESKIIVNRNMNDQISFREPYEVIVPENDIKKRVEMLGFQPWGFAKSYAEVANLSQQSKQYLDKLNKQLPSINLKPQQQYQPRQVKPKSVSKRQVEIHEKKGQSIKSKQEQYKKQLILEHSNSANRYQQAKSSSKTKDYLENSPIRKRKLKPISTPKSDSQQFQQINSIRNGNRNNYKFRDRATSKQIKQAWEEILFKRRLEDERRQRRRNQSSRQMMAEMKAKKGKELLSALDASNISEDSYEVLSNISRSESKHRKVHKIYEYPENDKKKQVYPLRCFTLKISNVSITQPQADIVEDQELQMGKFVKFSIKDKVTYFTEVIFNGTYNSILWKMEGCLFEELQGHQRLEIEIYQTLNNRIKPLGKSQIRVNRLHFLRNNHIYNGTIIHHHILSGQYTIGFDIYELSPFEVIEEEDEEHLNTRTFAKKHFSSEGRHQQKRKEKPLKTFGSQSSQSQKQIGKSIKSKGLESTMKRKDQRNFDQSTLINYEPANSSKIQESMSMPMGIERE